ncbi:hypothetical protein F383_24347 [Gossypium arboreum]|uniref:Uncharacterized protein n=1 Tax=Gossypium arboreum TaxID=29729 RepID=A0A0B0P2T2_GOSAR|nr:hypothetical protein F383_24347 [Gossypium arboreum]
MPKKICNTAQVISTNPVIRLMSRGINKCGYVRAAVYWSVGPAWKYESMARNGQRIFSD